MITLSSNNKEKITLLLVEDHGVTRLGLQFLFAEKDRFKIIGEAINGDEAVKLAQELQPDVVLMDIEMPVMDGIDATAEIRKANEDIKIIMLTVYDDEEKVFTSLAAGAHGYCLKDVSADRLMVGIESVYSGDLWLSKPIAEILLKGIPHKLSTTSLGTDSKAIQAGQVKIYEPLSERELEVLNLIAEGLTNKAIGDRLFISAETVKTHIRHIMEKMAVSDRTGAAIAAVRHGLL